jgi:7,8-dihydro-6-hydroxymethylpterin dimethyltransferase
VPVDAAARAVCRASQGKLTFSDFVSRPSAHPLCYLICYMLKSGDSLLPFARFAPRTGIEQLIGDSYLIRPGRDDAFFTDVINELYAQGRTEHLATLRGLVEKLYPAGAALTDFDRQRIAESAVRTVYVHAHMDEDTFDCSRAMQCPDLVPAEPGRLIPACTYNLFYRMKDERFFVPGEGGQCARQMAGGI